MEQIEANFLKALNDWYEWVSLDHYKDRDCHWEIGLAQRYSYGTKEENAYYFARHEGYLCEYYEEAQTPAELKEKVTAWINKKIKNPRLTE